MQAAYAYQQQQRPYQQTARPQRASSSSASSAYNPVPISPSLSLSGFPDAEDLAFTDQAMLMLSDTEMPPMALPSASAAAGYSPLPSPHSSPVPRLQQYGEQPLQVGASSSSSSSSSSLPPHHRQHDAYHAHSMSPQPPPSPPTYDPYGHSGPSGSYSPSQSYPRRAADVKSESQSSHPAPYQHGSSSGRSPRPPYAYHGGVAMPAVPHPYQQLRSVSASTSPRLVPAAAPYQLQHVSASYPSSPPQPAFTVQSATALPPRALHSSSSSSPSSGSSSPAALSASHLLSALTAALSSSSSSMKQALPVDDILAEAARQLQQQHSSPPGSSSPSPLLSPRRISSSASPPQDRKHIALELQSFTGLLLAVAASAAQRPGQDRRAEAVTQATVVPAAVQSHSPSYLPGSPLAFPTAPPVPPHRGSLPALLPSALYSPHVTHDNQQQQFARHTSRSRSKSRRRHRHQQRSRHRSATPAGEGERGSLQQAEDVAHKLEELSFDEGDGQGRRAAPAETEAVSRVAAGGRSRSLSSNRQSARDRSLSVKRKRQSGPNSEWAAGSGGLGDMKGEAEHAYYEGGQEAGGAGGDDDESSVSSYDSDDDSVEEEEDGAMLDDAAFDSFMPPLDETLAAFSDSHTNSIFSPFDSFPAAAAAASGALGSTPPHASSSSTTTSPNTASPPGAAPLKRKPGRPSKPGGPARPRPRTVYSPLNEEELRQRRLVKVCLQRENITQSDLARIAGVSKASMCTWLQGSTSTNMHSKIWSAAVRWMRSVEDRHREQGRAGQPATGAGGDRRGSGGQGREDRGGGMGAEETSQSQELQTRRSPLSASDALQPQQPVSPATTASTHSSSSHSSSSTA